MLIYDNELLKKYYSSKRLWQGIPSIEVTKNGRIFLTFYSGGTKEEVGNFSLIVKSDDGENFSEPIVVTFKENHRCFDPCIWIDPQGRLWWTWSEYYESSPCCKMLSFDFFYRKNDRFYI